LKGKDEIKELFSDKLGSFEAQVKPELWSNIASQLGATASVASTGISLLSKTIIGLGIGAAAVTTILLVSPTETVSPNKKIVSDTTLTPVLEEKDTLIEEKPINVLVNKNATLDNIEEAEISKENLKEEVINEVFQTQNYRADVSLIDVKKEEPVLDTTEGVDKTEEEKPNDTEKNTASKHEDNTPQNDNVETKKTYSLEKLPNIFTPNGDGNNDILSITSEGLLDFTVVVLDESQTVVFESNNPDFKWDGLNKFGEKVKAGTYGYYIIAKDSSGNKVNKFTPLQIVF